MAGEDRQRATMRSAHRTYRAMNWRGPSDWPFARCLRLAHAEIAGRRDLYAFAAVEASMRALLEGGGDGGRRADSHNGRN